MLVEDHPDFRDLKETLQVAWVRHLEYRAKVHSRPRSEEQLRWSWLSKLAAAVLGFSSRASCAAPAKPGCPSVKEMKER